MFKTLKSFYFSLFFLFVFLALALPVKAEVMAPKINKLTVAQTIALAGEAPAGSDVLVYLDGNLAGRVAAKTIAKDQSSFDLAFKPATKLAEGTHWLMAIAQDKTSLVMSAPSAEVKFSIDQVPAPTLIKPEANSVIGQNNQIISGLTKSGTKVLLYLNNLLLDKTEILKHNSGTASFFFKSNLSLGQQEIYVVAEDANQKAGPPSAKVSFKVELPMPAPTMLEPVVNARTTNNRPFIVGLAKNNSKIKVYIDKKYQGEFSVENHQSGTANFAYRPAANLSRGSHQVYAVAVDRRGKTSINSNLLNFQVKTAAIAQGAAEERSQAVASIGEVKRPEKIKPESPVISKTTGQVEGQPSDKSAESPAPPVVVMPEGEEQKLTIPEKLEDWLGTSSAAAKTTKGGLVNEGEQNQGKLKLSVALFILFLVGVVGWLIWVNRELIKERQAQAPASEKKKETSDREQNKML